LFKNNLKAVFGLEILNPGAKYFERNVKKKAKADLDVKARFDAYIGGGSRPRAAAPTAHPFRIGPRI